MRNLEFLLRCLPVALLLSGAPASALELIYPADLTYVVRSDYLVIKGGDSPVLDGVSIEINKIKSDVIDMSSPEYRATFGDFLIVEPVLDSGDNLIVVEGYAGGQLVATTSARVFYQDDPTRVPTGAFRPFVMHLPEREALCVNCHDMSPSAKALEEGSGTDHPCGSCHARSLNRPHVHGPAGVYQCTYCHDPDSAPAKYQVKPQADATLCGDCHSDKLDEFRKRKFVHGPIEAGMCQVCHDAHASDEVAQLVRPVNELCLGCHAGIDSAGHILRGISSGRSHPLEGAIDPSTPGRKLSCASCHDPHAGMAKQYFVREVTDRMNLCRVCHKK